MLMKYVKLFLVIALVAILLYIFLQNVDFKEVLNIISGLNPLYPLVFFVGLYCQFFVRAYRWGLILKPHAPHIPILSLYNYTVIGFFISLIIPGRVGEPARGILLAQDIKIRRSYGLASVVIERLIDSTMVVLLFMISLFFIDSQTSPLLTQLKNISYIVFPFMLLIFVMFYQVNTPTVFAYVERLIRFLGRLIPSKYRERLVAFGINFVKGLRLNLTPWQYLKLFLSSAMVWIFLIPFYWFLMQGFDFGAKVSLWETVPYFSIIVAAASIPTPGMAGSFDAASRHSLENLFGVATNPATAYTILVHFLIFATVIIPGLVALWSKGLNLKTILQLKRENQ